jgi:5-enolpyruvylshikimate-3-phosphate synthase
MKSRVLTPITQPFDVRLTLPGSKSFANRALVCAALAGRPCSLSNLSPGDDTALMLNVLADLGWSVRGVGRLQPPAWSKAKALEAGGSSHHDFHGRGWHGYSFCLRVAYCYAGTFHS